MAKHTDWFKAEDKPVNHGVFQRRRPKLDVIGRATGAMVTRFHKFDGVQWYTEGKTPAQAAKRTDVSAYQELDWRGLAVQS